MTLRLQSEIQLLLWTMESLFQVGDILEFGDATAVPSTDGAPSGHYYKITGISTHVLTIARFNTQTGKTETGGLRHAVVDNC